MVASERQKAMVAIVNNCYLKRLLNDGLCNYIWELFLNIFARIMQMRITFAMPFKLHIKPVVRFLPFLYILVLKSFARGFVGDLALWLHTAGCRRFYNTFCINVENFAKRRGGLRVQF